MGKDVQMKIEIIGEIVDQPDGSGLCELDIDEEGKQYLMQLGFEVLLLRGMDAMTEAEKNELDAAYQRIEQLHREIAHLVQQLKDKESKL